MDALHAPSKPPELDHLYRLAHVLRGRSGIGMSGFAPLSPVVLESHCRLTHWTLHPEEVEAMYAIDTALNHPEPVASVSTDAPARVERAWPTRKAIAGGAA